MPDDMRMNLYQRSLGFHIRYPNQNQADAVNYCVLGLSGEAGEVSEKWKKVIRDNDGYLSDEVRDQMILELGDVLWYVARLADHLGVSLSTVARLNIDKLDSRVVRNKIGGSGDNR